MEIFKVLQAKPFHPQLSVGKVPLQSAQPPPRFQFPAVYLQVQPSSPHVASQDRFLCLIFM